MAIQDSDPERRNLVITSLSFIVFYLAGGHIPENTLKLQIVNITFNNTHVLIITAWLMLAWFAIRYWQTHKGLMTNEIVKDTCSLLENKALINFVERVSGKKYRVENGFVIKLIQKHFGIWSIAYATIGNAQYNKKGKLYIFSEGSVERIELEGARGLILLTRLYLEAIITKPGFTSYAIPYLLFYTATCLGIIQCL